MRVFIAISLPDATLDALLRWQAMIPVGRPTPEGNLHLTISFLGEQTAEMLEELHLGLEALRVPSFTVTFPGLDLYPGGKQRLIVARVADQPDLTKLHRRVRGVLAASGIRAERRRFRPHVTLTRITGDLSGVEEARLAEVLAGGLPGAPITVDIGDIALFRSTLHPSGAVHEELARYPMG